MESDDELSERQSEPKELELSSSEPEETCQKHHQRRLFSPSHSLKQYNYLEIHSTNNF